MYNTITIAITITITILYYTILLWFSLPRVSRFVHRCFSTVSPRAYLHRWHFREGVLLMIGERGSAPKGSALSSVKTLLAKCPSVQW